MSDYYEEQYESADERITAMRERFYDTRALTELNRHERLALATELEEEASVADAWARILKLS